MDVCGYYLKYPQKFAASAKQAETMFQFSVYEQGIFDEIYFSGGLRFKEESMPDYIRYVGKGETKAMLK
jgi:hypothetical protein